MHIPPCVSYPTCDMKWLLQMYITGAGDHDNLQVSHHGNLCDNTQVIISNDNLPMSAVDQFVSDPFHQNENTS